jgi:hypothetical protein
VFPLIGLEWKMTSRMMGELTRKSSGLMGDEAAALAQTQEHSERLRIIRRHWHVGMKVQTVSDSLVFEHE